MEIGKGNRKRVELCRLGWGAVVGRGRVALLM